MLICFKVHQTWRHEVVLTFVSADLFDFVCSEQAGRGSHLYIFLMHSKNYSSSRTTRFHVAGISFELCGLCIVEFAALPNPPTPEIAKVLRMMEIGKIVTFVEMSTTVMCRTIQPKSHLNSCGHFASGFVIWSIANEAQISIMVLIILGGIHKN